MVETSSSKTNRNVIFLVLVASLGYFVDIYDLLVFSIVRMPSLLEIGVKAADIKSIGISILNWQMFGLLIGGLLWGIMGDKLGRIKVLFGSILLYSIANFVNGRVTGVNEYIIVRFIAGIGLAGELGAGITLVTETMKTTKRGYGTMIVSVIGLFGAAAANLVAKNLDWHWAYYVGGILGIFLLLLRLGTFESGLYKEVENRDISRGNFLMLFTNFKRFIKYLYCILVGAANWFVIGILITLSPEFGKALGAKVPLNAGDGVFYSYIGIAIGGVFAGLLSQATRSRRLTVVVFVLISALSVVCYLSAKGITTTQFMWLSLFLGFGVGYWPIFVTIPAEQFGTNIRATVTTTVPNFIRASLIPISTAFSAFSTKYGMITSGYIMIAILSIIALFSVSQLKESFHKDLDYVEEI
ncbi:MAG: MFS transporter [Bacteroidetes bacterium]|nr:MFS transporter [Bacteroidota bacterium]